MSAEETAELLARECSTMLTNAQMFPCGDDAFIIMKRIPLVELLNVARCAQVFVDTASLSEEELIGHKTEMTKALTSLRAKLPKGAL